MCSVVIIYYTVLSRAVLLLYTILLYYIVLYSNVSSVPCNSRNVTGIDRPIYLNFHSCLTIIENKSLTSLLHTFVLVCCGSEDNNRKNIELKYTEADRRDLQEIFTKIRTIKILNIHEEMINNLRDTLYQRLKKNNMLGFRLGLKRGFSLSISVIIYGIGLYYCTNVIATQILDNCESNCLSGGELLIAFFSFIVSARSCSKLWTNIKHFNELRLSLSSHYSMMYKLSECKPYTHIQNDQKNEAEIGVKVSRNDKNDMQKEIDQRTFSAKSKSELELKDRSFALNNSEISRKISISRNGDNGDNSTFHGSGDPRKFSHSNDSNDYNNTISCNGSYDESNDRDIHTIRKSNKENHMRTGTEMGTGTGTDTWSGKGTGTGMGTGTDTWLGKGTVTKTGTGTGAGMDTWSGKGTGMVARSFSGHTSHDITEESFLASLSQKNGSIRGLSSKSMSCSDDTIGGSRDQSWGTHIISEKNESIVRQRDGTSSNFQMYKTQTCSVPNNTDSDHSTATNTPIEERSRNNSDAPLYLPEEHKRRLSGSGKENNYSTKSSSSRSPRIIASLSQKSKTDNMASFSISEKGKSFYVDIQEDLKEKESISLKEIKAEKKNNRFKKRMKGYLKTHALSFFSAILGASLVS